MFHVTAHEMGVYNPRMRIWTTEMKEYGQFNIVRYEDIESLHKLFGKMGVGSITVHNCEGTCNCKPLSYGDSIRSAM